MNGVRGAYAVGPWCLCGVTSLVSDDAKTTQAKWCDCKTYNQTQHTVNTHCNEAAAAQLMGGLFACHQR
jgi:hypothetical protein